jgi:uncharacterized protein YprB with RNaseH-like and TPR domain
MLEHTFLHLSSIGPLTELGLWRQGVLTWDDLERHLARWPSSPVRRRMLLEELDASRRNRGWAAYFNDRLPRAERWRLYRAFRESCAFLDIETTGMSAYGHEITVIGLYDGKRMYQFVNGENLEEFEDAIERFDLLVTFNGARFDLPFISTYFRTFRFRQAHIDLCFLFNRLGYRGGLKKIEPLLGITREPEIQGMGGCDAVILWQRHLNGDPDALPRLLLYNQADVVNLELLMERAWEGLHRDLELAATRPLPCP